ncbi:MAG: hypothetical protein ACRBFS_07580 [Aureispira sp.]
MERTIINKVLQYSCICAILFAVIAFHRMDIEFMSFKAVTTCSSIISIIVLFWTAYFSMLWKWKFFKNILYKENLNGTWFGTYKSRKITDNDEYEGEIVLIIRQNFLNLNVKSFTESYINYSFGEAMNYDVRSESHRLVYLYSQSEFNPTDNNIRKGASELMLLKEFECKKLFGDFWTNHNSKGTLSLERVSQKHYTSFKEVKSLTKIKE